MTGKVQKGWWVEEDSDVLVIIGPRSGHVRSGKKGVWEVAKIDNACFWDDPAIEAIDRANARLIAAAPDLFEALEEYLAADDAMAAFLLGADPKALGEMEWRGQHSERSTRRRNATTAARAAIAKAEGR